MRIQIGAYDASGYMIEDWSANGRNFAFAGGERGDESLRGYVRKSTFDAAYWRERRGAVFVRAAVDGLLLWRGRLEDVAAVPGGMRIMALGGFRAFLDAPYTNLWSTTSYAEWEPVTADDDAFYNPELFEMDNNNRLYISPKTSQTYSAAAEGGGLVFKNLHRGNTQLNMISFVYSMTIASGWTAALFRYDEGFAGAAAVWTLSGSGAVQSGARTIGLISPCDYLVLVLYRPSSGTTFAADIGSVHIKLTNVRLAAVTGGGEISTTLGTNIAAGTRTVTPGSMTNIYVGQALTIGGTNTERVLVTAVTATTFTAVFAFAHVIADTVQAIYVSADAIAGELVDFIAAVNPEQIDTGRHSIVSGGRDLLDEIYEDKLPADILIDLATRHNFEVGIENEALFFRPRGSEARTWYVDATIEVERTLEALQNSAYSVYSDERGRTLRTAVAVDSDSVGQFGLTRRAAVFVDTASDARASQERDGFVDTYADPEPRVALTFSRVYAEVAVPVPLYLVRAGDYIVARNHPGGPQFLVAWAEYELDTDVLAVEAFVRSPTVAEMLVKGQAADVRSERTQRSRRRKARVL